MELTVRPERTGERDLAMNDRHRLWGWNCPSIDIDYFAEYENHKAAALIEYKRSTAKPQNFTSSQYRVLVDLGNRASLPVFAVRYFVDGWWFRVTPMNRHASPWVSAREWVDMSERSYVRLLYRIRKIEAPESVIANLSGMLPDIRPVNADLWQNRAVRAHMWEGSLSGYPCDTAA